MGCVGGISTPSRDIVLYLEGILSQCFSQKENKILKQALEYLRNNLCNELLKKWGSQGREVVLGKAPYLALDLLR